MRGISTTNKCGFQIDKFWCEYFQPDHPMPDADERDPDYDERDSDHDERNPMKVLTKCSVLSR